MPSGWYPFAIVDEGESAGEYTDNGEPKGLFHTTEGKNYAGAKGAYIENRSWPHITATYEQGFFQCFQHTSIFLAARSLKNLPGGVETNKDRIFQIECVGTADRTKAQSWGSQYVENWPQGYKDSIKAIMRWAEGELLIPRLCHVTFKTYPESYGNNGVRLSGPAFDAYSGWLGHQHAPENDHGDPGLLDIAYLLDIQTPSEPTMEELMLLGTFILINPNGTFWLVYPEKEMAFEVDGDANVKLDKSNNVEAFSLSQTTTNNILRVMMSYGLNGAVYPPAVPVPD